MSNKENPKLGFPIDCAQAWNWVSGGSWKSAYTLIYFYIKQGKKYRDFQVAKWVPMCNARGVAVGFKIRNRKVLLLLISPLFWKCIIMHTHINIMCLQLISNLTTRLWSRSAWHLHVAPAFTTNWAVFNSCYWIRCKFIANIRLGNRLREFFTADLGQIPLVSSNIN